MNTTKSLVTGPDKELVEALRQQAKRDSINRTPEQREARRIEKEKMEQAMQAREDDIRRMREEGLEDAKYYDDELENDDKWEMSYNMGLAIVAAIFAGFIFLFYWFYIRKIRNNIRDVSYMKNEARNTFDNAVTDSHLENMSTEEREQVEKLRDYLNK